MLNDVYLVAEALQEIEFVLWSMKDGYTLHPCEIEQAHNKAQMIKESLERILLVGVGSTVI